MQILPAGIAALRDSGYYYTILDVRRRAASIAAAAKI